MRLKNLINKNRFCFSDRERNIQIRGITCDSRKVKQDYIFFAICGNRLNGERFIPEAIENGAKVIILQKNTKFHPDAKGIIFIKVDNIRKMLSNMVSKFYSFPEQKIKVVGVTGTNGKTTLTYLIENILNQARIPAGVIGTVNYRYRNKILEASNTTPNAEVLQFVLSDMIENSIKYAIIEVSSHALQQERVSNIVFSDAIFTNLTQDHLDYHHNMESYFRAKSKLFTKLNKDAFAYINIDDIYGRRLIKLTEANKISYSIDRKSDIQAFKIKNFDDHLEFFVKFAKTTIHIKSSLIGRFNIYNILAACAFGLIHDISPKIISLGINRFKGVPGRLERVSNHRCPFQVFVDYAHTQVALKNVVSVLKNKTKARLILVFGCGGNRDKRKRPKMGKVASRFADKVILTADNPREEDAQSIIQDIKKGMVDDNYQIIVDRLDAIKKALSMAKEKDIVLIAGKGHEGCQIFKDKTVSFDDREVARRCLRLMNY